MADNLIRNRMLCLDQARGFLAAAERVVAQDYPHIVYHLSLLALEEVGKANMIAGQIATGDKLENRWIDKAMASHTRKLQWAVWSPIDRIDPQDFQAASEFAERAHAMRLASLYVDAKAEITDLPAHNIAKPEDAERALALARARLDYEDAHDAPDPDAHLIHEPLRWFLDAMTDQQLSRQLLSKTFINQYHALGNDAAVWIAWAKSEIERRDQEAKALLQTELSKPAVPLKQAKPKWRANVRIYTSSHSIRPKVLQQWNNQIEAVQLLWSGKKDQFILQLTFSDNAPLPSLVGRAIHLAKLVVACLNIGSIGYFWFESPGFERQIFDEIHDLENGRRLNVEPKEGFWGNDRAVALTNEHIDHAIRCMMAFAPLSEDEAAPIFKPYYDGLALLSKSDAFYSFDAVARRAFVGSLAGALARYGGWDGAEGSFRASFDEAFEPLIHEPADRDQMFLTLTPEGDPKETQLANLRAAKQLADLYLILVGRRTWSRILNEEET